MRVDAARLLRAPRAALATLLLASCVSGGGTPGDDYLRYVWVEVPGGERVHLRWQERQMPLRVHLPRPPAAAAGDPDAIFDAVRDGITDWTDVAAPGLPSFVFVDEPGEADIPIVWEEEPTGWFVAQCVYDIHQLQRRFGVARILVTTRWRGGRPSLDTLYATVLHETGHALGLTGHSPEPADVMYPRVNADGVPELTDRDRNTLRLLYGRPVGARVLGARKAD